MPILHRLVTIHNAAYRQMTDSDRNVPRRLCYSIGGLILMIKLIEHVIIHKTSEALELKLLIWAGVYLKCFKTKG